MKKVVVIDGQGGKIGALIVEGVVKSGVKCEIIGVGTNTIATTAMLKAGANKGATGENAVVVNARKADIIIGPIGIVIADSLYGEVTAEMAVAVGRAEGNKLLIPINHCENIVIGMKEFSLSTIKEHVSAEIIKYID